MSGLGLPPAWPAPFLHQGAPETHSKAEFMQPETLSLLPAVPGLVAILLWNNTHFAFSLSPVSSVQASGSLQLWEEIIYI